MRRARCVGWRWDAAVRGTGRWRGRPHVFLCERSTAARRNGRTGETTLERGRVPVQVMYATVGGCRQWWHGLVQLASQEGDVVVLFTQHKTSNKYRNFLIRFDPIISSRKTTRVPFSVLFLQVPRLHSRTNLPKGNTLKSGLCFYPACRQ